MSLKGFHIFFIAVSALLAFGLGATRTGALAAAFWFIIGVGLVLYGLSFRRKMKRLALKTAVLGAGLALLSSPQLSWACAVCFGSPDSAQTKGVRFAIGFLLAVIAAVLAGFAAFFIHLRRMAGIGKEETTGS